MAEIDLLFLTWLFRSHLCSEMIEEAQHKKIALTSLVLNEVTLVDGHNSASFLEFASRGF